MLWEMLLLMLILSCLLECYVRMRHREMLQRIPIVSKIPIVGSLLVLSSFQPDNLHLKFHQFVARYGKSFCANVFGRIVVVTADPRYVDELLSSRKHLRKHQLYLLLHGWLGEGLLLSHGKKWQTMRKIITPTFHFKILEQFVDVFDRQSLILVQKLQEFADGKTHVDIYPHMGLMTLDVIAETAMGVCVNAQLDSKSEFVQAVKDLRSEGCMLHFEDRDFKTGNLKRTRLHPDAVPSKTLPPPPIVDLNRTKGTQFVTNIFATRFIRPILAFPLLFRLLTPELYKKQIRGIAVMHRFTSNIIEERRKVLQASANENQSPDQDDSGIGIKPRLALLDVLLQAKSSNNGRPLSDIELRDEVNTFMFEGQDTTTSATSFCLYLLSRHVVSQRHLFEEIHAHFGANLARPITYHDLQDLTYLNCVIKETLRLYPPIPAIGRWLKEDLKLGIQCCLQRQQFPNQPAWFLTVDVTLPAGTNVVILLWQLLRDSEVFTDPERYRPERHLDMDTRANIFSNIPFSAGPRNCIGQRFALFEMRTVIVQMVRHFELIELGADIQPSIKIVLRSKTGIHFGLRQRVY